MPTWPALIPCAPARGSFQFVPENNVAEFAPDVGEPLRRRRYTAAGTLFEGDLALTPDQKEMLINFYKTDCEDGTLSFTMPDWSDSNGFSATFSWRSPPAFSHPAAGLYRASLSLRKSA